MFGWGLNCNPDIRNMEIDLTTLENYITERERIAYKKGQQVIYYSFNQKTP